MKTIPLTQGKATIVDDDDFAELSRFKWCAMRARGTFYAVRCDYDRERKPKRRLLCMHKSIMGTPRGCETDHVDGDGLNNRRSNLRVVTRGQNAHNHIHKAAGKTSRFRGVCWDRKSGRWHAQMRCAGRRIWSGYFDCEMAAAQAYDDAGFARDPEHFTPNFMLVNMIVER
jgi:hypothetical protein